MGTTLQEQRHRDFRSRVLARHQATSFSQVETAGLDIAADVRRAQQMVVRPSGLIRKLPCSSLLSCCPPSLVAFPLNDLNDKKESSTLSIPSSRRLYW